MYLEGQGVKKNERRAALLFRLTGYYSYEPGEWEYLKCLYYGIGVKQEVNDFTSVYSTYQLLKMIAEKGAGDTAKKHELNSMIKYTVSVVLFRKNTGYKYGFRFDSSYENYDKAWDEFVKQVDLAVKDSKHRLKIELYEESNSPDAYTEDGPIDLYHYEDGKVYRHKIINWEESIEEVIGDWEKQGFHPAEVRMSNNT